MEGINSCLLNKKKTKRGGIIDYKFVIHNILNHRIKHKTGIRKKKLENNQQPNNEYAITKIKWNAYNKYQVIWEID